ncbi:NUDIX hydrolase [Spongisporangium articulatum]|uniref:NUDIX hydrolase n=1 Tax=Spongisporangium articulatum TaxID=3362603 RepID=A0ABW8APA9_9ACTN
MTTDGTGLRRQVVRRPYALALSLYRRLPRFLRLFIIRMVAPGHTVGALALIEHEGRLLMLAQRHRKGWTFPGGLINRGENAAEAVVREVAEETGLHVEVGLPFATVVDPGPRRVDILFWVSASSAPDVEAAGEALRAAWVPVDDMGEVDIPTRHTLAEWARFRGGVAHEGRVLGTL